MEAVFYLLANTTKDASHVAGALLHATVRSYVSATQGSLVGKVFGPVILVLFLLIAWNQLAGRSYPKGRKGISTADAVGEEGEVADILRSLGSPDDGVPVEEGSMIPSRGLFMGNAEEAGPWENDFVKGKFRAMHRATYDRDLDKSGEYSCGEYFLGKKRLWEARLQWQFKSTPPDCKDVFFGIELEEYVPMNAGTKRMMSVLVETLKGAVGKQIYHSPGDDPSVVSGPLERPIFVMPLYANDQFIVTPPGEEPPSLMDPNMPNLGSKRVGRVNAYKKEIEELVFKKGYTYTFNFWGISQWLDRLNWQVLMPIVGTRVDFDLFCGKPPVHVVMYTLKKDMMQDGDKRHLQPRKNYMLDLAFWSSIKRPSKEVISNLFRGVPRVVTDSKAKNGHTARRRNNSNSADQQGFFTCCVERPKR
jgi:hypothetical protein